MYYFDPLLYPAPMVFASCLRLGPLCCPPLESQTHASAILQSPLRAPVLPCQTEPHSFKASVPSKHLAAYPSFPLGQLLLGSQLLLGMGLNQVRPFLLNEKQRPY